MNGAQGLRAELDAHRATGAFRYPAQLRERVGGWVAEQRRQGVTQRCLEETLGMKWNTLGRWSAREDPASATMKMLPVGVMSAGTPVLVTPSGYQIEGLSVAELVTVLRALS